MSLAILWAGADAPPTFRLGNRVKKRSGGRGRGKIGDYAVESAFEPGSVQIYPASVLEPWSQT